MDVTVVLLVISIILQATATILALRLALTTPAWRAWVLITAGLVLMLVRRLLTLASMFVPSLSVTLRGPLAEGISVVTSACMLLGTLTIAALFRRLAETEASSRRQREKLATVLDVVTVASQSLDLDVVLTRTLGRVLQVCAADAGEIDLLDEHSGQLVRRAQQGYSESFAQATRTLGLGEGLMGHVAASGQPLVLEDILRDPRLAQRDLVEAEGLRSLACVPLQARGRTLGVLAVARHAPRPFTPPDAALLTSIGQQVGVTVENARLYEQARRRADEMEALYHIGLVTTSTLALDEVLQQIHEQVRQLVSFDAFYIALYDEANDELRLGLIVEDGHVQPEITVKVSEGGGLTAWIIRSRQALRVGDVEAERDRLPAVPRQVGTLTRAWLGLPLIAKDRVVGVMSVQSHRPNVFDEDNERLLATIAAQAAIAIENARLYERSRAQARDLELLYEVGQLFSSSLNPQEVLSHVAHRCTEVSGADLCLVRLVEDDSLVVRGSYYCDDAERAEVEGLLLANPIRVGEGIAGQVVASGQPIISAGVDPAGLTLPGYVDYLRSREWLLVPLRAQDRISGVLTLIARRERRRFSARDLTLVQEIANQAAAALENARLYQEANRRLKEASLIQAVALEGAAGRPFDDIVADATERLHRLWTSHHLGFLFPDETGTLRVHASYVGLSPELKRSMRFQPGKGIVGRVAQTGQPFVVPDVRQELEYIEVTAGTCSEMAAPLLVRDRVIGVVNVESTQLNAFSADDLRLLSALAGQLAMILDNVQAHGDLADRAQQLQDAYTELAEAEQLKDQLVQNVSHELRTPLTFLQGYTALMLDETFGPLPAALREPLEIVGQRTGTVARLVERIVDLQAVRRETLAVEPLTLTELVAEAADRWQPQVQRAGIEMELDLPAGLPLVAADRRRLAEALDNLLGNAIKFSPQGGRVTMRLRAERDLVHVAITDTGVGIPPDKLSRIFDRFYQVDGTIRRRFGGAGVGLALVRQIAEAHGGRVWAESEGPGQGSTFHIVLPSVPAS